MNAGNKEEALTLELLQAIDQRSDVTQRRLANRLGVALGLANAYLKRCVRKGLVKVSQAPANRYLYYLTPKGFAEKSRLTGEYLRHSFHFFRVASSSIREVLDACTEAGCKTVVLCGASELAEIVLLRVREYPIQVIGVFDPDYAQDQFLSVGVWRQLSAVPSADGVIVTSIAAPGSMRDQITGHFGTARIWVPAILGLGGESNDNQNH